MYDQFGHEGPAGFGGGNPGGGYYSYSTSGFSGFDDFDLGDIFSTIFGGGSIKGADLRYNMEITFEEAFLGVEREITILEMNLVQHVLVVVQNQELLVKHVKYVEVQVK